ncbi:MAG: hypothetical protein C0622_08605 [Desulfuromonas sp.]|nr:MAG: hypothetical protein C0622_08605 [Desulfuromonas sp.]
MKNSSIRFIVGLLLVIGLVAVAGNALANVAANTAIINQATLSYDDGDGLKEAIAYVEVTVLLVPNAPIVDPGPDQETYYNGPNTELTNSFYVTATANGPDYYDVTTQIIASSIDNTTNPTATVDVASIYLGATLTFDDSSTTTSIVVPADGVADDEVNGIEEGDIVVIGNETIEVASVDDNASGTSTIYLVTALDTAPDAGVLVAEKQTVTVTVTAGTIATIGTDITFEKTLTVTSQEDGDESTTSDPVQDTYLSGKATLGKYVRNVTSGVVGDAPQTTYDGEEFYQSGVTAEPGDILEYMLVARNSGSGPVDTAEVNDVLPIDFVSLLTSVADYANNAVLYDDGTNTPVTYTAAANGDAATYVSATGTLTVVIDSDTTVAGADGIIDGDQTVFILYRVQLNND